MLKCLEVVLTCCALVALAEALEWAGMDARRAYLEDHLLTRLAHFTPEEILGYVVELKEFIYQQVQLPETADEMDRWVRELVNVLHEIGKVDPKNCFELERYSAKVNRLLEENEPGENLVRFAKFFHQKQLALCS